MSAGKASTTFNGGAEMNRLNRDEIAMNVINVDFGVFMSRFAADADYHVEAQCSTTHLNKTTGEIIEVINASGFDKARSLYGAAAVEDMRKNRKLLRRDADDFVKIPALSNRDHHEILQDFLRREWTADADRRNAASAAYFGRRSIGFWLRNVDDDMAIDAYFRFRDEAINRRAEEFLRDNGLVIQWV